MSTAFIVAQRAVTAKINSAGNIKNSDYNSLRERDLKATHNQLLRAVKNNIANDVANNSAEGKKVTQLEEQIRATKKYLEAAKNDLKGSILGEPRPGQRASLKTEIATYENQLKTLNNQLNQATRALEQKAHKAVEQRSIKTFKRAASLVAEHEVSQGKREIDDLQKQVAKLKNDIQQEASYRESGGVRIGRSNAQSLANQKQLETNLKATEEKLAKAKTDLSADQAVLNAAK